MAKSKAFKAVKQQQREEDLTATDALDAQFQELLQAGNVGLQFKAPGSRQDRPAPGSIEPQDAAYDRMRRELIFEAKAQVLPVAEWTKTMIRNNLIGNMHNAMVLQTLQHHRWAHCHVPRPNVPRAACRHDFSAGYPVHNGRAGRLTLFV